MTIRGSQDFIGAADKAVMPFIAIVQAFVVIVVLGLVGLLALRALGFRFEVKLKTIKGRRRRPIEPDEHTQFL